MESMSSPNFTALSAENQYVKTELESRDCARYGGQEMRKILQAERSAYQAQSY